MLIKIHRTHINRLYTTGTMKINGERQTTTLESTMAMLPVGIYSVKIVKHSERKQDICIFDQDATDTRWKIDTGHSWIDTGKHLTIAVGSQLIPGVIYKGTPFYERLSDRLEKAHLRKEPVCLIISEEGASHCEPVPWWSQPSHHNCLREE